MAKTEHGLGISESRGPGSTSGDVVCIQQLVVKAGQVAVSRSTLLDVTINADRDGLEQFVPIQMRS